MTWMELAIACLATARLTRMLILDTGPWRVFQRMREKLGVENPPEFTHGGLIELFNCYWCMSVLVAGPVVLAFGHQTFEEWAFSTLAVSFVAGALVKSTHSE